MAATYPDCYGVGNTCNVTLFILDLAWVAGTTITLRKLYQEPWFNTADHALGNRLSNLGDDPGNAVCGPSGAEEPAPKPSIHPTRKAAIQGVFHHYKAELQRQGTTMQQLAETMDSEWQQVDRECSNALKSLGLYLPHNHIPQSDKPAVKELFASFFNIVIKSDEGTLLGDVTLRELFTKYALKDITPDARNAIKAAKDLGLLRKPAGVTLDDLVAPLGSNGPIFAGTMPEPNGRCCMNGLCQNSTNPQHYCKPIDPSQPGDPISNPCGSTSDWC